MIVLSLFLQNNLTDQSQTKELNASVNTAWFIIFLLLFVDFIFKKRIMLLSTRRFYQTPEISIVSILNVNHGDCSEMLCFVVGLQC